MKCILSCKEKEYIEKLRFETSMLDKKFIQLNNLMVTLKSEKYINEDMLNEIRELSINNGGFLKAEYREIIWKKIFGVSNNGKFIKIDQDKNQNPLFIGYYTESNYFLRKLKEEGEYDYQIKIDVQRSVINSLDAFTEEKNTCKNFSQKTM